MLGARLAVPSPQRIPGLSPVPKARHAAMQRWLPGSSNSARASPARAQPESAGFHPSSSPGMAALRVAAVLKGRAGQGRAVKGLKDEMPEGAPPLACLSVTLPSLHCLIFNPHLFSPTSDPIPPPPSPPNQAVIYLSPFEIVSPSTPLSSDSPGWQGYCGNTSGPCRRRGVHTKKLGLCGQARQGKRCTSTRPPLFQRTRLPGTQVRLACFAGSSAANPRSLWGKAWIQCPVLPWSVDSCGQPPNLKSPSSCALSSRVHCQFSQFCQICQSCQSCPVFCQVAASRGWPIVCPPVLAAQITCCKPPCQTCRGLE